MIHLLQRLTCIGLLAFWLSLGTGCGPTTPTGVTEDFDKDGWTYAEGDCDDYDRHTFPGAAEIPYDGIDQDCANGDLIDVDADGYIDEEAGGDDCDGNDPGSNPGSTDVADGVDNDCDGGIDGTPGGSVGIIDRDRDGYAASGSGGNDCDDYNSTIHPGAVDTAGDGIDQDCDGQDPTSTTGVDADGDGYTSTESGGDDPDDNDPDVHPGASDPPGDGIDQDGDGTDGPGVIKVDRDRDTYYSLGTGGTDCNDYDPTIHPGANDIPDNGLDENCDGKDAGTAAPVDNDNDGFDSLATNGLDCDDRDPNVYPGAVDPSGDGIDQDCNGVDGTGAAQTGGGTPPVDQDRDGYVASYAGGNDCNDADPTIHPGAPEVGNDGIDQDCNGSDPSSSSGVDADGDGYTSTTSGGDDPDDNDPTVHPGADDPLGDGIDQDGSGEDGPGVVGYDHDGDGWDSVGSGGTDCNDNNASISPSALEVPNNSIDEDCDGLDGGQPVPVDQDNDGYYNQTSGGNDCNDLEASIHPGAPDTLGDCVDSDCNGSDTSDPPALNGEDRDNDGYDTCASGGNDCDDNNPDIHPGATDFAYNGLDEDCSGADLVDYDRDGFASTSVSYGTDCNDTVASINPKGTETPYNGIDENCDGKDLIDVDLDGYASKQVAGGSDCDDQKGAINPGAQDIPYNGVDEDCNGKDYDDQDQDGYASTQVKGGTDCNDLNPSVKPGATEQGDGLDNNCDGKIDENTPLYDDDGDGLSEVQGDCNDTSATIKPGAAEVRDGLDNDCNGRIDDLEGTDYYTLDEGWNFYQAGDYVNARIAFTDALMGNPFEPDAYLGLGWTLSKGELTDLTLSLEYLSTALTLEPALSEALAGRAAIRSLTGLGTPWEIASDAQAALDAASTIGFRYDLASDERVLLILARAQLLMRAFPEARDTLSLLDPAHGLDPYVPSTWKVNNKTYGSYRAAGLAKLKALEASLEEGNRLPQPTLKTRSARQ